MAGRVTIQDIADALGVSRNTVSKAINNTGILADATRDKVLKKAMEMGYKQFSYVTIADTGKPSLSFSAPNERGEIALFTTSFLGNSHFASTMLDKFQRELSQLGYSLTMYRILPDDLHRLLLPPSFAKERTAGIVCIELFDSAYSHMVCSLDLPVLFVDTPADPLGSPLVADKLYMDNRTNIYRFVEEMFRRKKTKIGFIGDYLHCHSFFERYMGYRDAMYLLGLPISDEYSILDREPFSRKYEELLTDRLKNMKELPQVFICANDFVALDAIKALKRLGYSVPKDVYLCGLDDSPESKIITPSLTTIHIHSQIMGYYAVHLLISRIKEPDLNYRTMHVETDLIYRESTED